MMRRENPTWLRPGKAVGIDCLKGGLIRLFVPSDVAYVCELQAVEADCLTGGEATDQTWSPMASTLGATAGRQQTV